jgi:hypothetical protein
MQAVSLLPPDAAYPLLDAGNAPADLRTSGVLDYSLDSDRTLPAHWPERLSCDVLDVAETQLRSLPRGLRAYELNLSRTPIACLPDDLKVEARLEMTRCEHLRALPGGLTVGTLILNGCTSLVSLPEGLDVWFLDLTGCWAFEHWPRRAAIRSGRLQLRGCTALRGLPSYLTQLSALNVRDCPNLTSLPESLYVSGWLDLAHSGLTDESVLPPGCAGTQLRWGGVNIDRRIAFHPERITVDEVLNERNAERRRVLLDRYGYGRFLSDANAEVLDHDSDPGGPRQLLRLAMADDEDLVALSCHCPSTARQYIIRVPPTTPSCHHAAAWIAGFDDPKRYRPLVET